MADYSAAIAKATAKIREKGMPMTFVRVDESEEYDPVTDSYPTKEVPFPMYGLKTQPTVDEVQGGIFSAGSMIVLMSGEGFEKQPDTTDYLMFSEKRWDITAIKPVAPAEQDILYKFQVKDIGTARDK